MKQDTEPRVVLALCKREAAQALSISERQLDYLRKRGEIPCFKLGRAVRFKVSALQEWLDKQPEQTGSADGTDVG